MDKIIDACASLVYMLRMSNEDALRVLVQCAGNQRRLADIVGMSEAHVSRLMAGRYDVPEWMVALAEAMDKLPRRDWPERWR